MKENVEFSLTLLKPQVDILDDQLVVVLFFRIRSGLLDVRKLLSQEIKVGLGTGKKIIFFGKIHATTCRHIPNKHMQP